ncbi:hypothetical protein [Kitasatospora sp. NPDC088783]|uniref:hypothetical protein n=1 Tax=Kitasatospora sp. NPDC088783 TaxID=3364077 RepID=UPI0037FB2004
MDSLGRLPRQDGTANGRIGRYEVHVSDSTNAWGTPVATGTFPDSADRKTVPLRTTPGRFLRLPALITEADVRGPRTSAAEVTAGGVPV